MLSQNGFFVEQLLSRFMLNSFVIVIIKNMFMLYLTHHTNWDIISSSLRLFLKLWIWYICQNIKFSLKQLDFYKRNKYQNIQAEQKEGCSGNALYGTRKIAPGRLLITLTLTITLTQGRSLLGDGGNFKGDSFLFIALYCKKLRLKTTSNAIFNMKVALHES